MAKVGNNQPVMKEELIRQLVNMGWNQNKVIEALKAANYVRDAAIEILLTSQQQGTELVLSNQFDHLSLENIQRVNEFPVGLKNVGNTCYVNSLFQIYFHISPLVEYVLTQNPLKVVQGMPKAKKECIELITQVYQLFSRMTLTNRKYLDPLNVLKHIVDESGNHIGIGQQQDAGEFNINFLARLEEGYTNKKPSQQNILTKSLQVSKGAHFPEDRGFIQSIFFGNLKEIIESKEQDGSQVCLMQEVDFGQIILDIQYKELYQAWYHFMHDQIDKFTTPLEFQTTATQEAWLLKVPPVLLFQLQRVVFDKKSNQPAKLHDQFTFPLTLYPDRFMYANHQRIKELQTRRDVITKQIEQIKQKLNQYDAVNNSGVSLVEMLT